MENRRCLECNEEIIGRSDKKFCDDQCRNAYNNKKGSEKIVLVKKINKILLKNRQILAQLNPGGKTKMHKDNLLKKGYDFKYHTHGYTTKENAQYFFCYDYGFLALDKDWFLLVKHEQK